MQQTEKEFLKDNGFKSRKFLLSLLGVIIIAALGLVFAFAGLAEGILSTVATSLVTIILGYSGITASRSVVPRVIGKNKTRETTRDSTEDPLGNKEGL